MKKLLALLLIAGIVAFVACGGGDKEKQKQKQDSLRKDSISKVHKADSLAVVEKEQQKQDSLRKDSITKAKAHHGTKPKPKHTSVPKTTGVKPQTVPVKKN
jgi:hypothetical protein